MNNQEKLQKEIQKIRLDMEKATNKKIKPLLLAYKDSLNDIRGEIGKIYLKYTVDGKLSIGKRQRYSILKLLNNQIEKQVNNIGTVDVEYTTKTLKEIYSESYYRTIYTIDKGVNTAIDFSLLNPKIIENAVIHEYKGKLFSDEIWKNKELLIKRLKLEINKGIVNGSSVDKIARRIKKQFGTGAYESKRLVNTQMARVITEAQSEIYKNSNVVKKVMYDATLDNKTCGKCHPLDGEYYDADSNYPMPPRHPNCRCCLIPVIEGWEPTKKRDNQTSKIIDYTTYDKWKKSKHIKQLGGV